ncbi:Hypothetical predicted protein [Cloeon dipterum]|uniref:Uncharacterized protein n=1 Tax=Cloeon dipterum TaxID=197152 RepID=A0A8S1CWI7_9INSE|nr:Hypothetical predicted protein [Cloeon dipterum]
MTLRLLLKNKKEQRGRSVPRQNPAEKRIENDLRPTKLTSDKRHRKEEKVQRSSRRTWGDILSEPMSQPSSYAMRLSPERDVPENEKQNLDNHRRRKYSEPNGDRFSEADDVPSLKALNPVRTLQFLIGELHSIVKPKGEREKAVFKMIEDVVDRLPEEKLTPNVEKRLPNNESDRKSSKDQISRTAYEILRKERDSLHRKLDEKSKSHLSLERKLAATEAKVVRLKAEREELKENYESLISKQKDLIATLPTLNNQNNHNKNMESHLESELNKAHMYITALERVNRKIQEKYKSKLGIIQDILNNGLDFQAQENARLTDVIGMSPLEEDTLDNPDDSVKTLSVKSVVSNKEVRAEVLSTSSAGLNAQKYIDKVMMNSGLLRPDQEHLFQSFVSIADQETKGISGANRRN